MGAATSARPLRVLLAAVGSRGDVQPMLALAQTLAARGHVPVVAAPPDFEQWVRAQGFEFRPLGTDMQAFAAANPEVFTGGSFAGLATVKRYFAAEVPVWARQATQAGRDVDAMLWAGLAAVVPSVAEHLHVPAIGVLYTNCLIPSAMHPPATVARHGMPRWINRLLWKLNRLVGSSLVGKPVNAARAELGLPPVVWHEHMWEKGQFVLALDAVLFPPDPAWVPQRFRYANYLFFDDPAALDADLQEWLDQGEPPVFVGFGSMSGPGTDRVGRMIVDALAATGRRCVVGAGWAGLRVGELPRGWRVVGETPHALLFPRMAAVVHHGGSGTMAQALRAGVPQVILPLILDQYHHAHRLFLANLIPRPVPMERITAQQLADAIQAALALPAQPREAVARRIRASDGREMVADRIEALLGAAVAA